MQSTERNDVRESLCGKRPTRRLQDSAISPQTTGRAERQVDITFPVTIRVIDPVAALRPLHAELRVGHAVARRRRSDPSLELAEPSLLRHSGLL
jgi:hypothetical protein